MKTSREDRGAMMIPVVSFVGHSNSGKTTLLEKVVRELKIRGYRVAIVKHTHHDFEIDRPGKDTWRLTQAGGDIVVLASANKLTIVEHLDEEPALDEISALFKAKVDIVLTEGYKNGNTPKIVVVPSGQYAKQLCREEDILFTVSAHLTSPGAPQFDDDDVIRITDLLIAQIVKASSGNITDLIPGYEPYQSDEFEELLGEPVSVHGHVCRGQVIGVE